MDRPLIITKAWIANHFERDFRWIRKHLLTNKVLMDELDIDVDEFKAWQSIPPLAGNRIIAWFEQHKLL